ncbi:MAG: signal peptide peptidase SppA [Dehalococcoidia bacterium]|nr:signal peptide peptidase SppA [Dehalococcoidia bacterium]
MRKGKVAIIGIAVLLVLAMLIPVSCISVPSGVGGDKIAVIPLTGAITGTSGPLTYGGVITPDLVREQLKRAEADTSVKAVILRVESPGGGVAPCQEILEEIEQAKQSKPVVVSMGSMAASGGYYISCKADRIVALPGTLTGSIGVIAQIPNLKGLFDKLGIEMQTFTGGEHKDMYAGYRNLTPEEQEIMQSLVDEYYEQFVDVVAEGRGMDKEEVRSLATGQLYTGVEAKELGLVDELGGLDKAVEVATELSGAVSPRVEYYKPRPISILSELFELSSSELSSLLKLRLLGLGGQDIVLLETLTRAYPQPRYLVSP